MKSDEFDIFRLFYMLKKKWKLGVFFALVWLIISSSIYFLKFKNQNTYTSNFTVHSSVLDQSTLNIYINLIQEYISAKDYTALADKMDISVKDAYMIYDVYSKKVQANESLSTLSVMTGDSIILTSFPAYVTTFLTNEVNSESIDLAKSQLDYKLARINNELDSLNVKKEGTIYISNESVISLIKSKQDTEKLIAEFSLFSVVHSFTVKNENPPLIFILLVIVLFSVSMGVIGILKLEFFDFLKKRIAQYEAND